MAIPFFADGRLIFKRSFNIGTKSVDWPLLPSTSGQSAQYAKTDKEIPLPQRKEKEKKKGLGGGEERGRKEERIRVAENVVRPIRIWTGIVYGVSSA